ncbi:MAG: flagellar hook-length control protein FliK [Thiohalomonadaceae bacterium]
MTPNTKTLESGLLGLDNAARPRTGQKNGADGFAEVFDAQVRGAGPRPAAEKPAEKLAERSEKPAENGPARRADKSPARGGPREEAPQAREADEATAPAEASAEAEAAGDPEPATDDVAAGEGTEGVPGNMLQPLLAEDGKDLPAVVPAGAPQPDVQEDRTASAEPLLADAAKTAAAEVKGVAPAVVPMTTEPGEESTEADLLPAALARKTLPARSAVEAPVDNTRENKAEERTTDGLLTALRFSRMMAQERGAANPVPELGAPAEGQAPTRGVPDALTALSNMTAVAGRDMAASPTPQASAVTQSIPVPLNRPGWDQAFSERVVWMTRQGLQEAHIQVTPREMGPIEVRISMQQDQVSVAFAAQNSAARDAIENALPRLREMLADSGLNLAQSEVSQQSPQERGDGREHLGPRSTGRGTDGHEELAVPVHEVSQVSTGRGMVDYFA